MDVFDFYADASKHEELAALLTLGAQNHPLGLAANFLEKDIWVTEILRLLYDESLMGEHAIAFKGGTALSKCWHAIERFSEDIDLSVHWADLAGESDEGAAWEKSTRSRKQRDKFRDQQKQFLTTWSQELVERLTNRFVKYGIKGLSVELEADSNGEKIDVHFPRVTTGVDAYQLDHVLLEFGGRNRGQPTITHSIECYLSDVPELSEITFPIASVQAYDPAYILWEKLTALHQFSTQTKEHDPNRLARHWYDVDCLLRKKIADPFATAQAMRDVVEMKRLRWAQSGVDYEAVLRGELQLVPEGNRLARVAEDHRQAMQGGMFFTKPDGFVSITDRLKTVQNQINVSTYPVDEVWLEANAEWLCSGAWMQAVITHEGRTFYSEFTLLEKPARALRSLKRKIAESIVLDR